MKNPGLAALFAMFSSMSAFAGQCNISPNICEFEDALNSTGLRYSSSGISKDKGEFLGDVVEDAIQSVVSKDPARKAESLRAITAIEEGLESSGSNGLFSPAFDGIKAALSQ